MFHYRRAAFSAHLKSQVDLPLTEAAALRITLNLDGSPIISKGMSLIWLGGDLDVLDIFVVVYFQQNKKGRKQRVQNVTLKL
jgi:hypothetical protein